MNAPDCRADCGNRRDPEHDFCGTCHRALPPFHRRELARTRWAPAHERAVRAAVRFLNTLREVEAAA